MKGGKVRLGRGLGSLLGEEAVREVERHRVRQLLLDQIEPNPRQPREHIDETALAELANSIKSQGVLQPVLVRERRGGAQGEAFELVAGERRWRAARKAGLDRVPAIVHDWDDAQALEVAILENVQREDLNAVETARGYQRLIDEFSHSHKAIAKRVGKSRMTVTNQLRLLKLPGAILAMVEKGELTPGHARALLGLEDSPELAISTARRVAEEGLSVRETERLVRERENANEKPETKPTAQAKGAVRDPSIVDLEKQLAEVLETRVVITNRRGRGRITLEYETLDALENLATRLLAAPIIPPDED
ncbi:MAG: ParB/RepB/Spo0J family partition protein [Magnetococcales bacterium]|nr:ParB/RepB/Spo0J family partition protein [Magnetococcales bacterium]